MTTEKEIPVDQREAGIYDPVTGRQDSGLGIFAPKPDPIVKRAAPAKPKHKADIQMSPIAIFTGILAKHASQMDDLSWAINRSAINGLSEKLGLEQNEIEDLRETARDDEKTIDFGVYLKQRTPLADLGQWLRELTNQKEITLLLKVGPKHAVWTKLFPPSAIVCFGDNTLLAAEVDWQRFDLIRVIEPHGFLPKEVQAYVDFLTMIHGNVERQSIDTIGRAPVAPAPDTLAFARGIIEKDEQARAARN